MILCLFATMVYDHMSETELALADKLLKQGDEKEAIVLKLQGDRVKKGRDGPSRSAVYRYLKGSTYKRDAEESRGRERERPKNIVNVAHRERKRLIKEADNECIVTWSDIHKAVKQKLRVAGALKRGVKMPGPDWLARVVRSETQVRARPGKRRITRTKAHEKARWELAKKWVKKPASFWVDKIHAYIDNKTFVVARTSAHKKAMRASRVTHHLRTPQEGIQPDMILPKKNRMLLGIPSVDITAAVGKDGIFFWYENTKPWNGQHAADMYEALGDALRKQYGPQPYYRVVEDGDTKGFQSNKGKNAKKEQKIHSWKLGPRSPGWMPLDYCFWDEIEGRVLAKRGNEEESLSSYKKRLSITAKRLPKDLVKKTIAKMKGNIKATVDSKGSYTELE